MKVVALHSGGLDSTVMLAHLLKNGHEVKAISFNYGQKHSRELEAASNICSIFHIPQQVVNLTALRPLLNSVLTRDEQPVPEGTYTDEVMKATVVPNRNMIMLSIAAAWAISLKFNFISYAAHAGDHTIYPDCQPDFATWLAGALARCDFHKVLLLTPFIQVTKANIVKLGASIHAPMFETWSCYKGGALHCGKCGTCVERREAFALAGIVDSTQYETGAIH